MSKEKNKVMKRIVILSFLALGFLFVYTCVISNLSRKAYKEELNHSETVVNEFVKRLSDGESFHSMERDILKEIKKMEMQDATNLMDYSLYVLYESVRNKEITEAEKEVLKDAINQAEIDITKVKDENLKENLETYKQMHIIVRYLNGSFLYDVDYDYFVKTYRSHILPEYQKVLEFYLLEKTKDYYNSETLTLYPEEVERRLEILYNMINEKENGVQDIAIGAYMFYKSIYLGVYQPELVIKSQVIQPKVLESYASFADKTKDENLKAFLKTLVSNYESENYVITDTIMKSIDEFCGIERATPSEALIES